MLLLAQEASPSLISKNVEDPDEPDDQRARLTVIGLDQIARLLYYRSLDYLITTSTSNAPQAYLHCTVVEEHAARSRCIVWTVSHRSQTALVCPTVFTVGFVSYACSTPAPQPCPAHPAILSTFHSIQKEYSGMFVVGLESGASPPVLLRNICSFQ